MRRGGLLNRCALSVAKNARTHRVLEATILIYGTLFLLAWHHLRTIFSVVWVCNISRRDSASSQHIRTRTRWVMPICIDRSTDFNGFCKVYCTRTTYLTSSTILDKVALAVLSHLYICQQLKQGKFSTAIRQFSSDIHSRMIQPLQYNRDNWATTINLVVQFCHDN